MAGGSVMIIPFSDLIETGCCHSPICQ